MDPLPIRPRRTRPVHNDRSVVAHVLAVIRSYLKLELGLALIDDNLKIHVFGCEGGGKVDFESLILAHIDFGAGGDSALRVHGGEKQESGGKLEREGGRKLHEGILRRFREFLNPIVGGTTVVYPLPSTSRILMISPPMIFSRTST